MSPAEKVQLLMGRAKVTPFPSARASVDFDDAVDMADDREPVKSKPIAFRSIHDVVAEQREPKWLLHKILEAEVLAVLAGPRGTFKSFIALDWAMRMACNGHVGIILSGEGAGIDRRIAAWLQQYGQDVGTLPLKVLERALNLNTIIELEALREAISQEPEPPTFIMIDTFSKFSAGINENDNGEVAAFLAGLSSALREEFKATVLLVVHTGHGDDKRPRGASSLMANNDAEYMVNRPANGMLVSVSRERFKDTPSMPPLGYEATVVDLGRFDSYGDKVTSLVMTTTDAPQVVLNKTWGGNQEKIIGVLKEWARANIGATHISTIDLNAIFTAQKIDRRRRREVIDSFVNNRILSPAACGYTFHRENL